MLIPLLVNLAVDRALSTLATAEKFCCQFSCQLRDPRIFPRLQGLLPWVQPLAGPGRSWQILGELSGALEYQKWLHAGLSPPQRPGVSQL